MFVEKAKQRPKDLLTIDHLQPELDRVLKLAWQARAAAEQGDLAEAARLRAEHDRIYAELAKRLP